MLYPPPPFSGYNARDVEKSLKSKCFTRLIKNKPYMNLKLKLSVPIGNKAYIAYFYVHEVEHAFLVRFKV